MDLAAEAIKDTEQAAEKVSDHVLPQLANLVTVFFAELRKTRVTITIDLGEKE